MAVKFSAMPRQCVMAKAEVRGGSKAWEGDDEFGSNFGNYY